MNAPEILYRAHWLEGQLLWSEHRVVDAVASHRRAVEILEETKPVASEGYGANQASFQIQVGEVYLDLVNLLLLTADMTEARTSQQLVAEAVETLEKLKGAELRDYFQDECIAEVSGQGRGVADLAPDAAVVYTVSLPDRIELIVGMRGELKRYQSKATTRELQYTIDAFRRSVQNPLSLRHQGLGRRLHEWLVDPYRDELDAAGISTLVFVPDGRLRTVPFAALTDGETYLADRYAMATAISLDLLVSPKIENEPGRPVLAGVSEAVQGFSPLEAVDDELSGIQELRGGEVLLNKAFTLEGVRNAVSTEIPGVVHLATHAVFSGDPDSSFLLTYAGRVGFEDLSDVVGMTRVDGNPLDLLVLSACETAVGNDRAGLGFAGTAIRAGARSAIGSLWPIADEAAQRVMLDFYAGLRDEQVTKAEALQQAQAALRTREGFEHPYYWAPFTLVNDWL